MRDILVLLATMGGGLGCFLLGMKHLSEGLQSVGGASSAPGRSTSKPCAGSVIGWIVEREKRQPIEKLNEILVLRQRTQ